MSSFRKIVVSAGWTASSRFVMMGAQFIVFAILARTLSPSDFGLVAFASAIVYFFRILSEFGVPNSLVQAKQISDIEYGSAFVVTSIIGVGMSIAAYSMSTSVAAWADKEEVHELLRVLSLVILLGNFCSFFQAFLKIEMAFKSLAMIQYAATILSSLVGVTMAFLDYGIWALVSMMLVEQLTLLIGATILSTSVRKPTFAFSLASAIKITRSGSKMFLQSLVSVASQRADVYLLGLFASPAFLGQYSVGTKLFKMIRDSITQALSNAAFSGFARMQDKRDQQLEALKRLNHLIAIFAMPLFVFLAEQSWFVVPLLFGDQWKTAAHVLSLFSYTGIAACINYMSSTSMVANGYVITFIRLQLVYLTMLAISFISMGYIAWELALLAFVSCVLLFSIIRVNVFCRKMGFDVSEYWQPFLKPLLLSLLIVISSRLIEELATTWNLSNLARMLAVSAWSLGLWIFYVYRFEADTVDMLVTGFNKIRATARIPGKSG
jgi:O-antigen/teichoic acid export membrane protein